MLKLTLTFFLLLTVTFSFCQKVDLTEPTPAQKKLARAIAKAWLKKYSDSLQIRRSVKLDELKYSPTPWAYRTVFSIVGDYQNGVYTREQADSMIDIRLVGSLAFIIRGEYKVESSVMDTVYYPLEDYYEPKAIKRKYLRVVTFEFDRKIKLLEVSFYKEESGKYFPEYYELK